MNFGKLRRRKEGVFEFHIATKTPQRITLRITLADEAGNRSKPEDFSFEAIAIAILQVSPTSLSFSGDQPLTWSATVDASWVRLSVTQGMLAPGTSSNINVLRALPPVGYHARPGDEAVPLRPHFLVPGGGHRGLRRQQVGYDLLALKALAFGHG
jgi:hypothetical protein